MTEKTLTTENIKPALDALRGELAPWPVVAKKQDRLNATQKSAVNSGITSSLVAQIIANTAAIRALESAITGTGLRALVVASLPAVGTLGILYIVPVTTYDPATDADVVNYSNEYIWIVAPDAPVTEGYYEQVGQTGIVINNGQLTITVNGTSVGTFTANQSGDTTAAITVPTNADYVDRTTDQTVAGVKTFSSTINGTASKAIADEDGTSIKTGYVNVAGNQTVSGQKTFSDTQSFKDSAYTQGVTVTDRKQDIWRVTDSTDTAFGTWEAIQYTDGRQGFRLCTSNKYKNGTLDPTGNIVPVYFEFLQRPEDGSSVLTWTNGFINNSVYPLVPNTCNLGNALYQWAKVYAQTYYYNGTQWGLDQNNTWSGDNTFTQHIKVADTSWSGSTPPSSNKTRYIEFVNNSDIRQGRLINTARVNSTETWIETIRNVDSNTSHNFMLVASVNNNGDRSFFPLYGDANLGSAVANSRFKTLNGVNPGALSLPDFTSETGVSLSAGANTYTPVLSGWLSISTTGDINVVCGNFCHKATDMISVPVIAGKTYTVTMPSTATGYFYSCLGNV